ncbi:alpha/beta fold hydrolase [Chromobacterium violaceum]|uniref:3-oxoadipate enol-lactonase 2 n=2 Tax=Chromobacterium violaceum TaxID=536 RepID=A0A1R0MKV8_CHRVL|nr:alpha/beta hydrolase [Chromobacterium violaceum]AAQ59006.1 3-oxoadipate enol-lactonase [Chromobacterium violaceum ATCC 12472]ATP28001.1 alpha/beta hydrolase [Chromobacterium violaceum]ATP31911.1 alpha/beta hydrolase [Chromobacterium violaceum]KJH67298.1 3-oxoadipate enol-lactonase [Chromobacterium violaceum]KMN48420.1 3-oxoadipate enol-lactonase [Chromobacterium violaceum]
MPHAQLAGYQVYYEESGHGSQPLLLLNGITMSTVGWTLMMPLLEPHFRVIRMDFLGQGQSEHPPGELYALADQADLAAALLDWLQLPQAYVAGLSYGGMVAQHLAHRHPGRLSRLLLAGTLAWADTVNHHIGDSWIAANNQGGLDLRYQVSVPWLFSSRFLAGNAAMLDDLKLLAGMVDWDAVIRLINGVRQHDARTWLPQLQLPVHILVGDEDRLTPLYQARLLQELIPGAELEVLPGAAHVLHIEAVEAFARAIVRFRQD